jgi:TM2 domain-containing membrane protein YozV
MSEFSSGARTTYPQFGAVSADARAIMLFEANRRSNLVAYLLWLFLGLFGAHNFYLRRTGVAVTQLILSSIIVGMVITIPWVLVDAFLIPGWVRGQNNLLAEQLGA